MTWIAAQPGDALLAGYESGSCDSVYSTVRDRWMMLSITPDGPGYACGLGCPGSEKEPSW